MAFERDKTKPVFEDFVVDEIDGWRIWFLVDGNPCGRHKFRIERIDDPAPATTYETGFDVMNQKNIITAGWNRLRAEYPVLSSYFLDMCLKQFPRCESCNEQWRKMGCV